MSRVSSIKLHILRREVSEIASVSMLSKTPSWPSDLNPSGHSDCVPVVQKPAEISRARSPQSAEEVFVDSRLLLGKNVEQSARAAPTLTLYTKSKSVIIFQGDFQGEVFLAKSILTHFTSRLNFCQFVCYNR